MPAFMTLLRQEQNVDGVVNIAAYGLEFLILTGKRLSEVSQVPWSEIKLEKRLWTIPEERQQKNDEAHIVPLSDGMLAILAKMQELKHGDYVFPGFKGNAPLNAKTYQRLTERLVKKLEVNGTPHGFRSSLRDWSHAETSFAFETCEEALAHTVGSKVSQAYKRQQALGKLGALFVAWDNYLAGQPANVTALRAA
jgi:integrase